MRQITFRAWHKPDQKYEPIEVLGFNETGILRGIAFHSHENTNPESVMLEQFTGLFDKHGRGIFEGDLLRYPSVEKDYEGETIVSPVRWSDRNAAFVTERALFLWRINTMAEVAGNIHENPELLPAK